MKLLFRFTLQEILYFLILFFIISQFGRHFWPPFSFVSGLRVDYLSPTLYVTDILILFLFLSVGTSSLLAKLQRKKSPISLPVFTPPLVWGLLLMILLSGIVQSERPLLGLYMLGKLLEMMFFAWYTMHFFSQKKTFPSRSLVMGGVLSLGVVAVSVSAIGQYAWQHSLGGLWYFLGERTFSPSTPGISQANFGEAMVLRPYATFPHPNVLGGYLLMTTILVSSFFSRLTSMRRKLLFFSIIALGSFTLFLTMSRVALLLWGVSMSVSFWKKRLWVVLCAGVLLVIVLSPFFTRVLHTRFTEEAFVQRMALVKASLAMAETSPLIGVGLGNFLVHVPDFYASENLFSTIQPVHNVFLLLLAEIGYGGLFCVCVLLKYLWKRVVSHKERRVPLLLIAVMGSIGLVDHYLLTLQQGQLMLAFVVGFCLSTHGKK